MYVGFFFKRLKLLLATQTELLVQFVQMTSLRIYIYITEVINTDKNRVIVCTGLLCMSVSFQTDGIASSHADGNPSVY